MQFPLISLYEMLAPLPLHVNPALRFGRGGSRQPTCAIDWAVPDERPT